MFGSLSGLTLTKITPWVTDANNLKAQSNVNATGNTFTYSILAKSVTSLVVDG